MTEEGTGDGKGHGTNILVLVQDNLSRANFALPLIASVPFSATMRSCVLTRMGVVVASETPASSFAGRWRTALRRRTLPSHAIIRLARPDVRVAPRGRE